jgi:hypothetical protein
MIFDMILVILFSEILSSDDVGSSSISIFGFFKNILAIANLCFSHHDNFNHFSHISVSIHFSNHFIRSYSSVCFSDSQSLSSSISSSSNAYIKFSFIVQSNTAGS